MATSKEETKELWKDCLSALVEHDAISSQDDGVQLTNHETSLTQNPYMVSNWIAYIDDLDDLVQQQQNPKGKNPIATNSSIDWMRVRDWVGRRAVFHLPRSYKLWKRQWEFTLKYFKDEQQTVLDCFEQAIVTLGSFPRVWVVYLQYLLEQTPAMQQTARTSTSLPISHTFVRRVINRALQSVPVTQHEEKLWKAVLIPSLLDDKATLPIPTRSRLLQRYAAFQPSFALQYGQWCEHVQMIGQAAVTYQSLLSSSSSTTTSNQQQELWQAFGNLCSQHSEQVEAVGIPWEAVLRTALRAAIMTKPTRSTTEQRDGVHEDILVVPQPDTTVLLQGMIYSWLANAWVQRGAFDLARSVYEEGLTKVTTVRDFSLLYEAYLALEEGLLEHAVQSMDDEEEDNTASAMDTGEDDWDILLETTSESRLADMELAMARAEHLTRRRPLLLNAVHLRQDPKNVQEWLTRAELYLSGDNKQAGQAASTLEEALDRTVQGVNHGSRSDLVIQLSKIYTDNLENVDRARSLLERVCRSSQSAEPIYMSKMEDLAACWSTWIELELKHEKWDPALALARESVALPSKLDLKRRRQPNLTKNLRLWDLLLDLEESLGTVQTTKDAYNRALEIKAATVQHILNYGVFLKEHNYFEESFAAYERGIEVFAFPHPGGKLLWKAYLTAFLDRYKGEKVERTRDLFQRCLEGCPPEDCAEFFMLNGEFEEQFGLTKRALSVYQSMCHQVQQKEKFVAYQLYAVKATKYLGVTATRDIYQEAIENLEDKESAKMCIEFAKMEMGLQEADRARAILTYGAQMADPRQLPEFWKVWNDFEIANGNEETFREMLRVKRSVEAAFSTVNYNASGMSETTNTLSQDDAIRMIANQEGVELAEASKAPVVTGFVAGKRSAAAANLDEVEERLVKLRKVTGAEENRDAENEEEIDIDDIDDIDAEIEEAAAQGAAQDVDEVTTKQVPAAVFGGLAQDGNE